VTRGGRCWPPIDGWARNARKNAIAVGGMVAAGHSASQRANAESVAIATKVHSCHAATVRLNAANDVYVRSERLRSSTDTPMAMITTAASSAETAWTFTAAA
jgi:hypothetical protein